jgi:phosphoenolpyruvate carboxylase
MTKADQPLRDDVHLLGDLLGATLRTQEGEALFDMVERVRALSKTDFDALTELLASHPASEALPVARAFAHFLTLANIAEQHHRVRRRREYQHEGAPPQPGSCEEVFARLHTSVDADRLYAAVTSLRIELVLTAHPTEVVRRTLLQKHRRIAELLAERDHDDLTEPEKREIVDALRREITSAWETDEVRHERPSPLDEVKGGLFVFEQTLWDALPRYLRVLDDALRAHTNRALPLDAVPISFGSWIGGDRDGNPNVTADVTGTACLLARWVAADLYLKEIDALRSELSMKSATDELPQSNEPYRDLLKEVRDRLRATRTSLEEAVATKEGWKRWPSAWSEVRPIIEAHELLEPLLACHRSLLQTGNGIIAEGRLQDVIRRVYGFGVTLVRLDVRQESTRHTALLDALEKNQLLDDDAQEDLRTFRALATIPRESLGAYVITMARNADDVLNVKRLLDMHGVRQRIVPLFETINDLRNAGATIEQLFANEEYRASIDGHQEVMVGYSDSSKDSGRFTAAWELYQAQEQIVAACAKAGVSLTLFHGRGGSVGRGGGPTYLAIRSQPPGSIDGRLRVTVQGEMIQAEFGLAGIALRTLEVYTTATLEATLARCEAPRDEWRAAMRTMSDAAARSYRGLVYETPRFLDYFRQATPEIELGELNIGSRPARRGAKKGVESLRAIPWQFAWTQNRLLLPSWLGVDAALAAADAKTLDAMMREWPFFQSTIELLEMVLAKTESRIAAYYDRLLVAEELRDLGEELRERLVRTIELVQRVTGHATLLESNRALRRSIDVRNPYVDPINVVQAELLRRMRASDDASLRDAFVVTVNGIAAGMRNTG